MNGDRLPSGEAVVLMALIRVYARHGRATVRAVSAEANRSVQTTHHHLVSLADRGLVAGAGEGAVMGGALRPLVEWRDVA